jgi:putative transposon-encoded protein
MADRFFKIPIQLSSLLPIAVPKGIAEKFNKMPDEKKSKIEASAAPAKGRGKVKLEIYGEEMVEKVVKLSGNSGRVYLPPDWVGCRVKIVRVD